MKAKVITTIAVLLCLTKLGFSANDTTLNQQDSLKHKGLNRINANFNIGGIGLICSFEMSCEFNDKHEIIAGSGLLFLPMYVGYKYSPILNFKNKRIDFDYRLYTAFVPNWYSLEPEDKSIFLVGNSVGVTWNNKTNSFSISPELLLLSNRFELTKSPIDKVHFGVRLSFNLTRFI